MAELTGGIHSARDVVLGNQTNVTQVIQLPPSPRRKIWKNCALITWGICAARTARSISRASRSWIRSRANCFSRKSMRRSWRVTDQPKGETWERCLAGRKLDKESLPAEAFLGKAEARPVKVEEALGKHS